jgi:hypothetical protein
LFQVGDECGCGLVDIVRQVGMFFHIPVRIPVRS